MMSTLVCTICSNVAVETSRSVVLPYVCAGCQAKATQPEHVDHEADVHVEQPKASQQLAEIFKDSELADDFATVEATVQMVSDLEEQLTVAKEFSQGQTELIGQLEQQIEILKSEAALATGAVAENEALRVRLQQNVVAMTGGIMEILRLQAENSELMTAFAEVTDVAKALAFYLGFTVEQKKELESKYEFLKTAVEFVGRIVGVNIEVRD